MSEETKLIQVKKDTHKELSILKAKEECKSFDEVIRKVILEKGNE